MRIIQIEQVLAIASTGSINKAAQKLYMSQPNLSTSLKELEEELGSKIFKRTGRGVELTSFGTEFISFSQPAYRQFKLLGEFCKSMNKEKPLRFSVASQYLRFANSIFTDILSECKDKDYEFSFYEGAFQDIVDKVRSHEAEIGLVILSSLQKRMMLHMFESGGMEYRMLSEEKIVVIVSKNHPLAKKAKTSIKIEELAEWPLVIYQDVNYSFTPEWESLDMYNVKQKITVSDRATLNEIVSSTNAYTIGVHNIKAYYNTKYYTNVVAIEMENRDLSLEIGIITNKSRLLSEMAKKYISLLDEALSFADLND